MTLIRFVPARRAARPAKLGRGDLERLVETFFGEGWLERNFAAAPSSRERPSAEMTFSETDKEYAFSLETPGFDRESVRVEVEGDVLTLTGKLGVKSEGGNPPVRAEGRGFVRRVRVPGAIAAEGHRAEVKNGILTVRLAKPAPRSAEPVKITIN